MILTGRVFGALLKEYAVNEAACFMASNQCGDLGRNSSLEYLRDSGLCSAICSLLREAIDCVVTRNTAALMIFSSDLQDAA
jgi:hypothetical protein